MRTRQLILWLTTVGASALSHGPAALSEIRKLVTDRGRCTLAEIGDHLRVAGVLLPRGTKLSAFLLQHPDEFLLTGPRNNRKVSNLADTTEMAMLETVRTVLLRHGPMTSAELRLRLREQRSAIPGLVSLLQRHGEEFHVHGGAVRLAEQLPLPAAPAAGEAAAGSATSGIDAATLAASAPAPLVRMHSLELPTSMEGVASIELLSEVVLLDLDNQAFALEAAACQAAQAEAADVLVLAFCARAHNPRLPQSVASRLQELAGRGRLRLLRPDRDGANAADFVLAFWAGWLHARLPAAARFVLVSADSDLEHTVGDALAGLGRAIERELPPWLEPSEEPLPPSVQTGGLELVEEDW